MFFLGLDVFSEVAARTFVPYRAGAASFFFLLARVAPWQHLNKVRGAYEQEAHKMLMTTM